jgi:uncharacterized protein YdcH (DUF465 family)
MDIARVSRFGAVVLITACYLVSAEDVIDKAIAGYEDASQTEKAEHIAKMKKLKDDLMAKLKEEAKAAAGIGNLRLAEKAMTKIKELGGEVLKSTIAETKTSEIRIEPKIEVPQAMDTFDIKQWLIIACFKDDWNEYTFDKLKKLAIKRTIEGTQITCADSSCQDMTLLFNQKCTGDFSCRILLTKNTAFQVKLTNKLNDCMYARLKDGDNDVLLERIHGKLYCKINGEDMDVSSYKRASDDLEGYIGIALRQKQTTTIKSFQFKATNAKLLDH